MIKHLAIGVIALGSSLSQCREAPRPHQQIFVSMNYSAPFDARPGDTVNIIMEPDATDPQGFCEVRGGSLWMNPFTQILICENVDF